MDKRDKIFWLVLLVALLALPAVGLSRYMQRIISLIFIYSMLALSLNIVTGYMGQVSLGHAAFYAIGAYTSGLLSEHFGWNFLLTCLCAIVFTGFIGWIFSLPTMKLSGTYLAIITMGFGEIVKVLIVNWESLTHGTYGLQNIAKPELFGMTLKTTNNGMYYLCLAFLVLMVLLCVAIERSKLGRTLRAIQDDPLASSLMGIELSHYKRLAFTISTALAGCCGALYAHLSGYVDANSFHSDVSMMILSIVIFGGRGSIKGMVVGAGILVAFPEVFRFLAEYRFIVYGLILIVMMVFRTDGLLGGHSKRPYVFPRYVKVNKEGEVSRMALLEVSNVSKQFGGLAAVSNVDFHVEEGEIVSIIGPNGAGKTTIFNLLTGVYTVTEGKIVFNGEEIQNKKVQHIVNAGIARTFQNIRLFKNMRTIENVMIGFHQNTKYNTFDLIFRTPRFRKYEKAAHEKALEVLDSLGFGKYIHTYAGNLPYGEQRKLEIARAIATGAKLLLLDEPAAGMNPQESAELLEFIKGLQAKGFTIILIEHDMSVVMNISDRIYVLDHGRMIADGLPEEIANNQTVIEAYLGKSEDDADD